MQKWFEEILLDVESVWRDFIHKCRSKFAKHRYQILELYDKSPKQKKNEPYTEYYFRIEKKYAIRQLDSMILMMRDYNVFEINKILETETDQMKRDVLILLKDYARKKEEYILLRRQIQDS